MNRFLIFLFLVFFISAFYQLDYINAATVNPTDDAYISSTSPTNNFGSSDYLATYYGVRQTYLKFDLSGIPEGSVLSKLMLNLYCFEAENGTINLRRTTDSWTESTLTWSNRPAAEATILAQTSIPDIFISEGGGWFSWNLLSSQDSLYYSSNITNGVLSIELRSDEVVQWAWFYSEEYADASLHPTLEYEVVPNGSGFDADDDGDIDAEDLASFAQFYGTLRYYKDVDGDQHSDGTVQYSASQPPDYYPESLLTAINGDCDDDDENVNPGVSEICDDGIDNDCDGGLDCDDEGCNIDPACCNVDDNPVCLDSQYYIGSVSGDSGSDIITDSYWNEEWIQFEVREDSSGTDYLSAEIRLTSPPNSNFDLYVKCDGCEANYAVSSTNPQGQVDIVNIRKEDQFGIDDTFYVLIEIRHHSGINSECANWDLEVVGNESASSTTCF